MHNGTKAIDFTYYAAMLEFIAQWTEAEKDEPPPDLSGLESTRSHRAQDTGA